MQAEVKELDLADIRLDGDTQPRAAVDEDTVEEYAEALERGVVFPPVQVVDDGASYWLWDGFHRLLAYKLAGRTTIAAEVSESAVEDARWLALGANQTHGLKRSSEDKRRAAEQAVRMRPGLSDGALADHCGVSDKTIAAARLRLTPEVPESNTRTGRDGRTRNTTRIGKKKGTPEIRSSLETGEEGSDASELRKSGVGANGTPLPPPTPDDDELPGDADPGSIDIPTDEEGTPLPPQARAAFDGLPTLRGHLKTIDQLRKNLDAARTEPFGSWVHWDSVLGQLKSARSTLYQGRPACVCPYCSGSKEECRACQGRGFVSRAAYENAPAELKKGAKG